MQPDQQDSPQPDTPPVQPASESPYAVPVAPVPVASDQPTPPQPLPYGVPDYLHLDPVTGQQKKPSKKWKLILGGIIVVILIIGFAVVTMVWLQGAPERQFYMSLDNAMHSSYVRRQYNVKTGELTLLVRADFDLSDPASPKGKMNYTYSNGVLAGSPSIQQEGEVRVVDKGSFYAKITKSTRNNGIKLNQWVKLTDKDTNTSLYDPVGLHLTAGSPREVIVSGNFSAKNRQDLVDFMRSSQIYETSNYQMNVLEGRKATVVTTEVSPTNIKLLNNKAATLLNMQLPYATSQPTSSKDVYKVWIDNDKNSIMKVTYSSKVNNVETNSDVNLEYPASLVISIP